MKFDHTTICKPVILRELLFYKSLNEDLKQFTPRYHGMHASNILLLMCETLVQCHNCMCTTEYFLFIISH